MSSQASSVIKVYGKGTYGCTIEYNTKHIYFEIIDPKLFGNFTSQDLTADKVVKVFFDKDSRAKEVHMDTLIKEIDPARNFTVPLIGECTIVIKKHEILDTCSKKDHAYLDKDLQALIMENGGISLNNDSAIQLIYTDLQKESDPTTFLIQLFIPLMEGTLLINQRGHIHRDIKMGNILYDPSKKRLNLIDFGVAIEGGKAYNPEEFDFLAFKYESYPPEFTFAAILQLCITYSDFPDHEILHILINQCNLHKWLVHSLEHQYTSSRGNRTYQEMNNLIAKIVQRLSEMKHISTYNYSKASGSIDGLCFLFHITFRDIGASNQYTMQPSDISDVMNFLNAPEMIDVYSLGIVFNTILEKLKEVSPSLTIKIKTSLHKTISKMIHPDMTKRMLLTKAITTFKEILSKPCNSMGCFGMFRRNTLLPTMVGGEGEIGAFIEQGDLRGFLEYKKLLPAQESNKDLFLQQQKSGVCYK